MHQPGVLEVVVDGERLPSFPLCGGRWTVGRHPECDLVLDDPHVSRRHLEIVMDEERTITARALGSKNPVLLNGGELTESSLHDGDELRLGGIVIVLRQGLPRAAGRGSDSVTVVDDAGSESCGEVARLAPDSDGGDSADDRDTRRLRGFERVAQELVTADEADDLLASIIDILFDALACDRAFVAMGESESGEPRVVRLRSDAEPQEQGICMSQSVLDEIQLSGTALLLRDVPHDLPGGQHSAARIGIRSVVCAPLRWQGEALGFLYADRVTGEESFTEEDLRFLRSVGRLLALALDERSLRQQLRTENLRLRESLRRRGGFVAGCAPMIRLVERVERVASREAPVLLLGETGTGKELVARMVHDRSERAASPFVPFNCALSSPALIESELFGHARGAFTDAARARKGRFQLAAGGTLFLDEIGEMPLDTQAKLLRVLQDRQVWPVGGDEPVEVDIRLVAATHRDLAAMREGGELREDLYYRIAVLTVELPPLRERGEDILTIAEALLPEGVELEEGARKALMTYRWPGNVRELQNAMEQAIFNAGGDRIRAGDLPPELTRERRRRALRVPVSSLAEMEAKHIRRALRATEGNKKRCAELLGISRETLYQKLRLYGILT